MALKSKATGGFVITIHQARLDLNLATIGNMAPFVELHYSSLSLSTRTTSYQKTPIWNETFSLEYIEPDLEIRVFHKPLFRKKVEVGRCVIKVEDASGWFEIRKEGEKTGAIKISLKQENETCSTRHTSKNSFELSFDYIKKLREVEMEIEEIRSLKAKYLGRITQIKHARRQRLCMTETDTHKQLSPRDLFEDTEKVKSFSEELYQKVQTKADKIQRAEQELSRRKRLLKIQEETLKEEELKIEKEFQSLAQQKSEIGSVKYKLQQQAEKIRISKDKMLEEKVMEVTKPRVLTARQKERQMQMQKLQNSLSPTETYKTPSIKPRLPLYPLSENSSRFIKFE